MPPADLGKTIFSASTLFSNASDGSGRLVVSSQFRIFVAVAAPITSFIIICWFVWIKWDKVRKKIRNSQKYRSSGKDVEAESDSSSDSDGRIRHRVKQASRPVGQRSGRWKGY
jgi:hypothetical protein